MNPISTDKAPAAIGPYSQGTRFSGLIFVSGQLPINPATGDMPDAAADQALQSLENAKAILEEAGSSVDKVLKATVFLADLGDFAAVNEVYGQFFAAPFPARSCFQVAKLPKDALVEIEIIAHE